jgi:hypothetical protein
MTAKTELSGPKRRTRAELQQLVARIGSQIRRLYHPAMSMFHDPSWGIGELMNAKVMELIYTSAKIAKADAFIDSSFMNPLFQAWQDVIRLNDDVSNAVETYWWRAWTASVNGVRLIYGDDWWAMERYFVPLTLAKSAWGIPNLYALQYRGTLGTEATGSIASGGYPVDISQASFRRVKAILDVYAHAPADKTQEPRVDPVLQSAGRTYSEGPLKGFFAAQTLNFGRVLVTYGSQTAQLTSVADSDVSVPLPKGFLVKEVSAVGFDGLRKEIPFKNRAMMRYSALRTVPTEFIVTRSTMQEAFVNQATRVALTAGADAGWYASTVQDGQILYSVSPRNLHELGV